MKALRKAIGSVLVGLACCVAVGARQLDEHGVKSAFVYNFVQFIEWPASKLAPGAPLSICILEERPIAQRLSDLSGRKAKGHPIRVRTITSSADAASCHVLFVTADDSGRLPELALRHQRAGLLLIGEDSGPGSSEAVITLAVGGGKIVFDINLEVATAQELAISSKLLSLARKVVGGAQTSLETADEGRQA